MRQFRSSTDAVFDIDEEVDGPPEGAIVAQAGPPAQESTTTVEALAAPTDDA